jgi:K+ transporter
MGELEFALATISAPQSPIVTEPSPRIAEANRFEIEKPSDDFMRITLRFGYMESPRVPAAVALMRKAGYKFDIMTTSFFLGKRTLKTSPASDMPPWQTRGRSTSTLPPWKPTLPLVLPQR